MEGGREGGREGGICQKYTLVYKLEGGIFQVSTMFFTSCFSNFFCSNFRISPKLKLMEGIFSKIFLIFPYLF